MADDYVIDRRGGLIHVVNAPSPAATSCLSIAEHLLDEIEQAEQTFESPPTRLVSVPRADNVVDGDGSGSGP